LDRSSWVFYLVAGNGFVLIAFGVGQLLQRHKRVVNYWSFVFFEYTGIVLLLTSAVHTGIVKDNNLEYFDAPIIAFAGTLFYFYFVRLANKNYRFIWKEQWLFIPPILFAITGAILWFINTSVVDIIVMILSGTSFIWVIFCCTLLMISMIRQYKENCLDQRKRLSFLIVLTCGVVFLSMTFFIPVLARINSGPFILAEALFLLAVYFYLIRYPELLISIERESSPSQHGKSKIAGLDVKKAIDRLGQIMEQQKPYLQDDLSLPDIANMIGLSVHQLSEILNKEMGTNFKTYINGFRIADAKYILKEKPEASILDVAFACGFRSKSAFNRIFRETTGMTPTEYRRKIAEDETTQKAARSPAPDHCTQ